MSTAIRSTGDPVEFRAAVFPFLKKDPVLNSVVLSSVEGRIQGIMHDPEPPLYVSLHEGGEVVGAVLWTALRGIVLGSLADDLVPPLVNALADLVPGAESAEGTATAAPIFAELFAARVGKNFQKIRGTRLHQLISFVEQKAAGTPRLATLADVEITAELSQGYSIALGHDSSRALADTWVRGRIELERLWLWEDEGRAASLVGRQGEAFGATRIGPVYTPSEYRGHGYASALTAHVTQQILAAGSAACLFTDLANPTSNKIYATIGYRPVADFLGFSFTDQGRVV
ncbi:acetyltransferase [Kribbella qitaiheensis]|uniref:Acetyltransferase n=1 Tax=Kribbella qitaiheensis TaxID=1544730 RepID=A0A7G6WYV7_9ACTN|nr:GNAT family N-acetyltransferase [Kribbella qitaiheensis]QNE19172.1 acetyltransferase [Kribbella qitaiheensis]